MQVTVRVPAAQKADGFLVVLYSKKVSRSNNDLLTSREPDWIRTNDLLLSLPATGFPASPWRICGLDYIFTISGVPRVVSTEPLSGFLGIAICSRRKVSPI